MNLLAAPQVFEEARRAYYDDLLLFGLKLPEGDVLFHYRRNLSSHDMHIAANRYIAKDRFVLPLLTGKPADEVRKHHSIHGTIDLFATRAREELPGEQREFIWEVYDFSKTTFPRPQQLVVSRIDDDYFSDHVAKVRDMYATPIGISIRH